MIVAVICLIAVMIGSFVFVYNNAIDGAKAETEREKTKAFAEGYKMGRDDGFREGASRKLTPNLIREYLGLPTINKEANDDNL